MLKKHIAGFASAFATDVSDRRTLASFLKGVRDGEWRGIVEYHRGLSGQARKANKRSLPAYCLHGDMVTRAHGDERFFAPSGALQVDIDHVRVEDVLPILTQDPHIIAAWASVSGDGVKAIIQAPSDNIKVSMFSAIRYFHGKNIDIDTSVSSQVSLCYVSYDPNLYVNARHAEAPTIPLIMPPEDAGAIFSDAASCDLHDSPGRRHRFSEYLKIADAAIEGSNGDLRTLTVAMRGRDLGLPPEVVLDMMMQEYNPRCVPPWEFPDLSKKVANAFRYASRAVANDTPEALLPNILETDFPTAESRPGLDVLGVVVPERATIGEVLQTAPTRSGSVVIGNTFNAAVYLTMDPTWQGALALNEMSNRVVWTRVPAWREKRMAIDGHIDFDYDVDMPHLRMWLDQRHLGLVKFPREDIMSALMYVASRCRIHPLRDKLSSLVWDGRRRLRSAALDLFAPPHNMRLSCSMFHKTMIGAVARVFQPGCKLDTMLVLEGAQGARKSSFINALALGYGREGLGAQLGHKDAMENITGAWLIEVPELSEVLRSDPETFKAFISTTADNFRKSYGRDTARVQRTCVFIGTTNRNDYLRDSTGNRRFWPIRCGTINQDWLNENLDQIWAEALVDYKAGVPWWFTEAVDIEEHAHAVSKRMPIDPWCDTLKGFLSRTENADRLVSFNELRMAIGLSAVGCGRRETLRINDAMRVLGWSSVATEVATYFARGINADALTHDDIRKLLGDAP